MNKSFTFYSFFSIIQVLVFEILLFLNFVILTNNIISSYEDMRL